MKQLTMGERHTVKNKPSSDIMVTKKEQSPAATAEKNLPKPSAEIVADVFQEKVLPTPSPVVVAEVFQEEEHPDESTPRTKGDIVGYSDTDESDDDDSKTEESTTDQESTTYSEDEEPKDEDSDEDVKSEIKFLPATVDGLCKRLRKLWKEFTREGKHEHRNEIVFILDELLRQDGITQDEYTKLNNILAESLDEDAEEMNLEPENNAENEKFHSDVEDDEF